MPDRERTELIARRAADAGPGARTVAEVREAVFHAFVAELRKERGEVSHYETAEQRG